MKKCTGCKHLRGSLCAVNIRYEDRLSPYTDEIVTYRIWKREKVDDMRTTGECGPEAKLFEPTVTYWLSSKIKNFIKLRRH